MSNNDESKNVNNKEFKKLLLDLDMTYEDFANRIGIDKATLVRYLNDNFSSIKLKTIKNMQEVLGVENTNRLLGIA